MTENIDLYCRLLCAADSSYGIKLDGAFDPSQMIAYYNNIGFLEAPTAISGGVDNIDAALVGINGDGIIVAFRGTLPPAPPITMPILLDWLQDFKAVPETVAGFPGQVHTGFYLATMNVWQGVLNAVKALRDKTPNAKIYVTGHSKGGALASLGGWLLHQKQLKPDLVVTFASPHTGTEDFAHHYNRIIDQIRYENYLDIVPFLPPEIEILNLLAQIPELGELFAGAENWNYAPVGTLQYIQKDGIVEPDQFGLGVIRIGEIIATILEGDISDIGNAHRLAAYALGYCRAVCSNNLCNNPS